jgi:hypothetical protein
VLFILKRTHLIREARKGIAHPPCRERLDQPRGTRGSGWIWRRCNGNGRTRRPCSGNVWSWRRSPRGDPESRRRYCDLGEECRFAGDEKVVIVDEDEAGRIRRAGRVAVNPNGFDLDWELRAGPGGEVREGVEGLGFLHRDGAWNAGQGNWVAFRAGFKRWSTSTLDQNREDCGLSRS